MVWVEKDLRKYPVSIPCHKQGCYPLDLVADLMKPESFNSQENLPADVQVREIQPSRTFDSAALSGRGFAHPGKYGAVFSPSGRGVQLSTMS